MDSSPAETKSFIESELRPALEELALTLVQEDDAWRDAHLRRMESRLASALASLFPGAQATAIAEAWRQLVGERIGQLESAATERKVETQRGTEQPRLGVCAPAPTIEAPGSTLQTSELESGKDDDDDHHHNATDRP
jgi:hypothetical protein